MTPAQDPAFAALTDRLRAGEEGAAPHDLREVDAAVDRAGPAQPRARIAHGQGSPEDVVQSIYRSFFRRCKDGSYRLRIGTTCGPCLAVIAVGASAPTAASMTRGAARPETRGSRWRVTIRAGDPRPKRPSCWSRRSGRAPRRARSRPTGDRGAEPARPFERRRSAPSSGPGRSDLRGASSRARQDSVAPME